MGDLFPTGMSAPGHPITFEYFDEGAEQKCLMRCGCGWSTEVEASILPWTDDETQVKFKKHIEAEGLKEVISTRLFRDKNEDSYELSLSDDQVKLDCYLTGSILGGEGTECVHTINGPKIGDFLAELGAKDSKDLNERLAEYGAEDWQDLHQVISKHQTDVSVWEDTDWSDSIEVKVAIVGEAKVGSVLTALATATCTEGIFPVTYQWYSNDALEGSYQLIESATKHTYLLEIAERGKFVRVGASASDDIGSNSSFSSSESVGPVV